MKELDIITEQQLIDIGQWVGLLLLWLKIIKKEQQKPDCDEIVENLKQRSYRGEKVIYGDGIAKKDVQ